MRRGLTLRREALTELAADELREVAGGDALSLLSCPLARCVLDSQMSCAIQCYTGNC